MNAFLVERLAVALNEKFRGATLQQAFTTSKDDLFLVLDEAVIKITFYNGEAYFQFPDHDKLPQKNRLPIFDDMIGERIDEIRALPYDRVIDFKFLRGDLVCYLFGRFSVCGFYCDDLIQQFPQKRKCSRVFEYSDDRLNKAITRFNEHGDMQKAFPFIPDNVDVESLTKRLLNVLNDKKHAVIEEVRKQFIESDRFGLFDKEDRFGIDLKGENGTIYNDFLLLIHDYSRFDLSRRTLADRKDQISNSLHKELIQLENKRRSALKRIDHLSQSKNNRMKGDLLMAYLHQIEPKQKVVTLPLFDGSGSIDIKLSERLTPQDNAQRYYAKAKNEVKEVEYAQKNLANIDREIEHKQSELDAISKVSDIRALKQYSRSKERVEDVRLPYRRIEFQDYELRIGKTARDNDELLNRYTTRYDLWLHAKDVSGSHVIIRNPQDRAIPRPVIEYAASLAAHYSKARNESLAAVMVTDRKYVRKVKGAAPGQVRVDREEVLLVEPKAPRA